MPQASILALPTPHAVLPPFGAEILELRAERAAAEARLRQMLSAIAAFRDGDFSVRLPLQWQGTESRIAKAFNAALARAVFDATGKRVRELPITVDKLIQT